MAISEEKQGRAIYMMLSMHSAHCASSKQVTENNDTILSLFYYMIDIMNHTNNVTFYKKQQERFGPPPCLRLLTQGNISHLTSRHNCDLPPNKIRH